MAVKIKLKRLGKIRAPYYRIVVADARTKRDGRAIEEIGKYHPKEDPSFIEVKSDRVQYWLGVGAQPTEAVAAILRVTGDWQKFKGLPAPPPMKVAAPKADSKALFEAAHREAEDEPKAATTRVPQGARRSRPRTRCRARRGRSGARPSRAGRSRRERPAPRLRRAADGLSKHARRGARAPGQGHRRAPGRGQSSGHRALRRGRVLEVRVHPDDLGKVIGRAGRTAKALRTVIAAVAAAGPRRPGRRRPRTLSRGAR